MDDMRIAKYDFNIFLRVFLEKHMGFFGFVFAERKRAHHWWEKSQSSQPT